MAGKGGRRGEKKKGGITNSMHNVEGIMGRTATQRRKVVTLQHLTTLMDSDSKGVCRGDLVMGESSKHNVPHVIVD